MDTKMDKRKDGMDKNFRDEWEENYLKKRKNWKKNGVIRNEGKRTTG